jgi:nitrogen fixation/metabolism regulation signal transduction histidine kinase
MDCICVVKIKGLCNLHALGPLQEKEDEIRTIKEQFNSMQSQIQTLISAVGCIDESGKKEVAKQLIESGMYKQNEVA